MLRQNVQRGALYLGLNDCGEPDEVTGVPVGTIALHKPPAISDEMENKAFKRCIVDNPALSSITMAAYL